MAEFRKDRSLFCVFHNSSSYVIDGRPCSHIFSGIVQEKNRCLELSLQDFDGNARSIDTDILGKQFNLAVMVPIPRETADTIQKIVRNLNELDRVDKWPFYFSPDMTLSNKYERKGIPARAPEGHIDPPLENQKPDRYDGNGQRLLVRINCVRMALMTAQMAGVNIANISQINPLSNTGEEVRDAIHAAHRRILTPQNRQEKYVFEDNFLARRKGTDKTQARLVLASDGHCIVQTQKKDFQMGGLCDALARGINGKPLFNWVSEGRVEKFVQIPLSMPPYLQKAFSLK